MERIHAGDPTALDCVLAEYWAPLVSFASRFLHDRDAAEDIVQEAILRMWEERSRWKPSEKLQGFLYRIVRNLALNEQDARRVRQEWAESQQGTPHRRTPTPADAVEQSELQAFLDKLVAGLPPKRQEIFVLSRYHGHSYRQIADIMEISPQTVANQMSAALDELREKARPHLGAFLARGQLRVITGGWNGET